MTDSTTLVTIPTAHKILVCLIGLPLSGKSHTAKIIKKHYPCTYISTGDIARSLMTTEEDRQATLAADLFPGEDKLRAALQVELHAAPNGLILLDGFPRSKSQVEFMHDALMLYFPTVIETHAGDDSTLMARALQRRRDTGDTAPAELTKRLMAAKTNMVEVHRTISLKMFQQYTILTSGDEQSVVKQFNMILNRIL